MGLFSFSCYHELMLKVFRLFLAVLALSGVFGLGSLLFLFSPKNPKVLLWIARGITWVGTKILKLEMEIEGREHFQVAPMVVISNHQNNFDMFPGSFSLPFKTVTLGKKDLIWIPIFGVFYWLSGNIMIDRKNKKRAWESLNKVKDELLEKKKSIWILPEGTRSRGRGLLPFKRGAFVTAINAGVPLVPVCFSSYHGKIDLNQTPSCRIRIKVLEPIDTKKLTAEDAERLADDCHQLMKAQIAELDASLSS